MTQAFHCIQAWDSLPSSLLFRSEGIFISRRMIDRPQLALSSPSRSPIPPNQAEVIRIAACPHPDRLFDRTTLPRGDFSTGAEVGGSIARSELARDGCADAAVSHSLPASISFLAAFSARFAPATVTGSSSRLPSSIHRMKPRDKGV